MGGCHRCLPIFVLLLPVVVRVRRDGAQRKGQGGRWWQIYDVDNDNSNNYSAVAVVGEQRLLLLLSLTARAVRGGNRDTQIFLETNFEHSCSHFRLE
jgi:hypothetical protein